MPQYAAIGVAFGAVCIASFFSVRHIFHAKVLDVCATLRARAVHRLKELCKNIEDQASTDEIEKHVKSVERAFANKRRILEQYTNCWRNLLYGGIFSFLVSGLDLMQDFVSPILPDYRWIMGFAAVVAIILAVSGFNNLRRIAEVTSPSLKTP